MIVEIALLFLTIIVAGILWNLGHMWKYRSLRHIPGPKPLPIIGNALEFGFNSIDRFKNIIRLMKTYGNIIKFNIGPNNSVLFVAEPDIIEHFVSSPKHITKTSEYDFLKPWIGRGLLVSTGSYWRKRRKIITPAFHFKVLEEFISIFNASGDVFVKKLSAEVGKEVFNIHPYVTALALDIICETAMGASVNALENPNNEYVKAVASSCQIFMERTYSAWKQFDIFFRFASEYKLQEKNLAILHNFTNTVIEKRRKILAESNNTESAETDNTDDMGLKKKMAFLDLLLNSTIDGKPLSDEDISEEVNTFMFAGHDTTATAISFALYELARNPEVQAKAVEEIKEILGNDKNQQPTMQDLNNLKYLELVIKESLRLYPSVPMYGRDLHESETFNGVYYPKGTTMLFFPFYMHRRSDLYPDPEKFDPERFLPENTRNNSPFTYLPFSAGPRNCIGQKFAMYEMKAVLSKVLQNYELLPVDAKHDIVFTFEVVLSSANGVNLRIKPRNL